MKRKEEREVSERMIGEIEMKKINVKRYMWEVRDMVNIGIREFDVREDVKKFKKLKIKEEKNEKVEREERDKIKDDVVRDMRERM